MNRTTRTLTEVELRGTEDVAAYSVLLRDALRGMAAELDLTAHELESTLEHSVGTMADRAIARVKARKVARRLHRARDLINGAATEGARFWTTYQAEYADMIHPGKRGDWKWQP